jgi:(E)-4-hydroxy-3-methylbut-2-enyl-diphosphate synthase
MKGIETVRRDWCDLVSETLQETLETILKEQDIKKSVKIVRDKIEKIKNHIAIPLIADIHFNHKLALMAIDAGVDGLRINPGNIGEKRKVAEVVKKASTRSIPIRIGVNAGSLEKDLLKNSGSESCEGENHGCIEVLFTMETKELLKKYVSLRSGPVVW